MMLDVVTAARVSFYTNKGYWKCGDACWFNKVECLRYITARVKNGLPCPDLEFKYFDEIFKKLDWSTEPTASLSSLYKERAQQIRDSYDYLIMMFSGGADSTNMLNAFLANNIKLDEIYANVPIKAVEKTFHSFNPLDTSPDNIMYEFELVTKPRLKQLSITHPNIKITVFDTTEDSINIMTNNTLDDVAFNGNIAPQYAGIVNVYAHASRYSGDVGIVLGVDKPIVFYDNHRRKFGARFMDGINTAIDLPDDSSLSGKHEANIEYFYITKDVPQLWQKQCFAIKNAVLHNPMLLNITPPNSYNAIRTYLYAEDEQFERILYPDIDISQIGYQVDKPQSIFFSEICSWIFNGSLVDRKVTEYYSGFLKDHLHGIDPHFIDTIDGVPSRLRRVFTEPIYF